MELERNGSPPSRRRVSLIVALLLCCASVSTAQDITSPPADSTSDLSTLDLEQLMNIEVVFAGSKHAQRPREVPSFVSVVTAAEIKAHGYRTLGDVLKTLPSFYVCNDRNYSYLGVRGFERPGDYGTRILLLVDGLRTNDNIFDQALIGEEFLLDMDLIDRIEVIRGPSAALYGSNAFFAVINVVTRHGRSMQGGEAAMTAASFGTYAGRLSYGRSFASDAGLLISASYSGSKGQRLYFPEFDSPSTNNGIADRLDRESSRRLFASLDKGNFSLQASNVSRETGIPTASFGTLFNDSRTRTVDGLTLASLTYSRSLQGGSAFSTRVHAGHYTYVGAYAYDPIRAPNRDDDVGDAWGFDADASHPLFARNFVTFGAEYRDNFKQYQKNFDPEPLNVNINLRHESSRWGMFVQDEVRLFQPLMLYAGVRYDRYETFGGTTNPRIGLIYSPGSTTTVKLLAGRAFRAPNEYELFYVAPGSAANPQLEPERIETLELVAERLIGGGVQIFASTFRNRLSALISQHVVADDSTLYRFENDREITSNGVELGVVVNSGHGRTGQLTYALQRTEDRASGLELTNSPRHMAKLEFSAPITAKDLTAGFDAQYLSSRRTLAGNTESGYVITNLSLRAPRVFGQIALTATLYNLFDSKYDSPGSDEHTQDIIQQDGRSFRVKTTREF